MLFQDKDKKARRTFPPTAAAEGEKLKQEEKLTRRDAENDPVSTEKQRLSISPTAEPLERAFVYLIHLPILFDL